MSRSLDTKSEKLSQLEGDQRDIKTKCNMVPVLDPGTENGNIGKLFKSK
jgi:hypothetical protein